MRYKQTLAATAIASLLSARAYAVSDAEWAALREEIKQMTAGYEARIAELENRVKAAEQKAEKAEPALAQAEPPKTGAGRFRSGHFAHPAGPVCAHG